MEQKDVKLEMWEVGGVPVQHACLTAYYRSAKVAVVVFDPRSSESCQYITEVRGLMPRERRVVAVAHSLDGGDCDVPEDVGRFCEENHIAVLKADAKTGENVDAVFEEVGKAGLS